MSSPSGAPRKTNRIKAQWRAGNAADRVGIVAIYVFLACVAAGFVFPIMFVATTTGAILRMRVARNVR